MARRSRVRQSHPRQVGHVVLSCSDLFSFSGLLLAYGILRAGAETWIWPGEPELGIDFTAGLTFLLICSSVTMVLAYANCVEKNRKGMLLWLGLTIFGGCLFLAGQYHEYWGLIPGHGLLNLGLEFGGSHYATTFYVITGFHGLHVLTGVIYLMITWVRAYRGSFDNGNGEGIEIAGLFWHFVDLVWILVFTIVYLIPIPRRLEGNEHGRSRKQKRVLDHLRRLSGPHHLGSLGRHR